MRCRIKNVVVLDKSARHYLPNILLIARGPSKNALNFIYKKIELESQKHFGQTTPAAYVSAKYNNNILYKKYKDYYDDDWNEWANVIINWIPFWKPLPARPSSTESFQLENGGGSGSLIYWGDILHFLWSTTKELLFIISSTTAKLQTIISSSAATAATVIATVTLHLYYFFSYFFYLAVIKRYALWLGTTTSTAAQKRWWKERKVYCKVSLPSKLSNAWQDENFRVGWYKRGLWRGYD